MAFSEGRFTALPASTLTPPLTQAATDGVTSATPLALWKFEGQLTEASDLAFGVISASILGTVAAASGVLHLLDPQSYASPLFMLLAGGLVLGAFFMASDMVGSPMTGTGCFLYGALIGVLVVVIRVWGGMPEGVMYAILLGNAVTPHIDQWIRPTIYGATRAESRP